MRRWAPNCEIILAHNKMDLPPSEHEVDRTTADTRMVPTLPILSICFLNLYQVLTVVCLQSGGGPVLVSVE
jgi:hypothetical protein